MWGMPPTRAPSATTLCGRSSTRPPPSSPRICSVRQAAGPTPAPRHRCRMHRITVCRAISAPCQCVLPGHLAAPGAFGGGCLLGGGATLLTPPLPHPLTGLHQLVAHEQILHDCAPVRRAAAVAGEGGPGGFETVSVPSRLCASPWACAPLRSILYVYIHAWQWMYGCLCPCAPTVLWVHRSNGGWHVGFSLLCPAPSPRRHKSDRVVNRSDKRVYRNGAWTSVRCEEIIVGDIVQVVEGDECPADIVLIGTSLPTGLCYIETGALPPPPPPFCPHRASAACVLHFPSPSQPTWTARPTSRSANHWVSSRCVL